MSSLRPFQELDDLRLFMDEAVVGTPGGPASAVGAAAVLLAWTAVAAALGTLLWRRGLRLYTGAGM